MDAPEDGTTGDGTAGPDRVNEIRREIEGIRFRIAVSIDALAYKVDVPSRVADKISDTASAFSARVQQRLPRSRPGLKPPAATPEGDVHAHLPASPNDEAHLDPGASGRSVP